MSTDKQKTSIQKIVDDLGGVTVVATLINKTPGAVSQWGERIPGKHFATLLSEAKRMRLKVKLEHLAGITPYEGASK